MSDAVSAKWSEFVEVNGHLLCVFITGDVALDDPTADTDPNVVEDRATMFSVECRTCWQVPEGRTRAIAQMRGRMVVADFAVNRRTGSWLVCHRPGIDDPAFDTVGLVTEHCRTTLVCCPEFANDHAAPMGYGDRIPADADALAAARMLVGFGRSPWEAVEVYARILHPNRAIIDTGLNRGATV